MDKNKANGKAVIVAIRQGTHQGTNRAISLNLLAWKTLLAWLLGEQNHRTQRKLMLIGDGGIVRPRCIDERLAFGRRTSRCHDPKAPICEIRRASSERKIA